MELKNKHITEEKMLQEDFDINSKIVLDVEKELQKHSFDLDNEEEEFASLDLTAYQNRSILRKIVKIQNFHVKTPYSLLFNSVQKAQHFKKIFSVFLKRDQNLLMIHSQNANTELRPYFKDFMKITHKSLSLLSI
mmetsp:Transcript_2998/g.3556  ORF Transcript_2998/g.3556 Transcript_2998/m.3556 type:complete len:135 (+) Transcript_2998:1-405(+)